jgi:hypothetical protein
MLRHPYVCTFECLVLDSEHCSHSGCMYVRSRVSMCMRIRAFTYTNVRTHVRDPYDIPHTCLCMSTCMCFRASIRMYVHTHIRTYMHTYVHADVFTHTSPSRCTYVLTNTRRTYVRTHVLTTRCLTVPGSDLACVLWSAHLHMQHIWVRSVSCRYVVFCTCAGTKHIHRGHAHGRIDQVLLRSAFLTRCVRMNEAHVLSLHAGLCTETTYTLARIDVMHHWHAHSWHELLNGNGPCPCT